MKFPVIATRTQAFADALPATPAQSTTGGDNILSIRPFNANGLPVQRIAVLIVVPAGGPASLVATLYFFEVGTGQWYKTSAQQTVNCAVTGTPGSGQVAYFDAFSICETPPTYNTVTNAPADASQGGLVACLIVTNPGALAAGAYYFAMAPVLIGTP